jgi:hypothetical protein
MLGEIYDLGVEAAGDVWPTPAMALSRLFERGAAFLDAGRDLPPIQGASPAELLDALNVTREDLFLVEALYLVTRHASYVLTTEGDAREKVWVGLADRHLAIRAEIVERRRQEEQLKRELKALGGTIVPLPEHEDLPMADGDRPRKSRGMYEHLFAGATTENIELEVPVTALDAADRAIEAKDWAQEWGEHARLLVLTHGISLALREHEADAIDGNDEASVKAAQAEARRRLMGLEGRYSTLRRRLFELRHNNRILQWRITALEVEAAGMRSRLDQFLIDRDRLEQAISDRRAAGAVPISEDRDQPNEGWRRRLGRWFGRGG